MTTAVNSNRKRKVPYSISFGKEWQPCEKPFEGQSKDGGINLGFNFWIDNTQIVDADISALISSFLIGAMPPPFLRSEYIPISCITIVAMQGLDPIFLARNVGKSTFLSKCSCVPVRHSILPGNRWTHIEAEPMTSLILWPQKLGLQIGDYTSYGISRIFLECSVVFHAIDSHWEDDILFYTDISVMSQLETFKKENDKLEALIKVSV